MQLTTSKFSIVHRVVSEQCIYSDLYKLSLEASKMVEKQEVGM
jgi:hypothetical protein